MSKKLEKSSCPLGMIKRVENVLKGCIGNYNSAIFINRLQREIQNVFAMSYEYKDFRVKVTAEKDIGKPDTSIAIEYFKEVDNPDAKFESTPTDPTWPVFGIFDQITSELVRGSTKHPNWPNDVLYATGIMMEEAGETMRAAVQYQMEGGDLAEVRKEAIQTAAMCLRLILHIDN